MRLPDSIRVSTAPEDLLTYGFDASGLRGRAAMVAWPRSADEVSTLLRYAAGLSMPVVPRGAGSGMTAGAVPSQGAMVLSFERMDRILEIDAGNLCVVVEPGVINGALQRALAPQGLFYPPDPASLEFCTLGGNVAENAGGPRALKYGVTRDYVMELEAVLPASGNMIRTGVRTHKGVVGYDLTRLLVGSEGTLAAITKIRLKVLPMPEAVATLLASFPGAAPAAEAVARMTVRGLLPRTLEFLDRGSIDAVESYKPGGLPMDAQALLLVEFDGHPLAIGQEAERAAEVCASLGARVERAQDEAARERLWETRRAVSPALHNLGLKKINEDIVVPRTRLPGMLASLERMSLESGIRIVNFGHAGDGNIHVNIMVPPDDVRANERAAALVREIFARVLALGGTISGEHGVGLTKAAYMGMEIGPEETALMRGIKALFDPRGLLNPGKIFQ